MTTDSPRSLADGRTFDAEASWQLHPQVSVRPESFGALLYHFGNRRLSFLKSRQLLDLVQALPGHASAREAAAAAGIEPAQWAQYERALAALSASDILVPARPAAIRSEMT